MGYNEKIKFSRYVIIIILHIIIYSCKSYSSWINVDYSSSNPITSGSLKLDLCNNEDLVGKIIDISYIDSLYVKTVTDSILNIETIYIYNDSLNLLSCSLYGIHYDSMIEIGKKYYFDGSGNIVSIIDTDEGYNISWKQATHIGDKYTIRKKKNKSRTWLRKSSYNGKKVWSYSFINKRSQMKEIIIDGTNGKILKELNIKFEY
jgi:hypothetical protein